MIEYDQPLFRPPAEANSFILQVSLGCSYNKCAFCSMYESKSFKVRSLEDIFADIDAMKSQTNIRRVFLADGDALACENIFLMDILNYLRKTFPKLQRVASYASPYNLLQKSTEELMQLREYGLSLIYYGIESGNAALLKYINKPMKPEKMIEGLNKATKANMKISATVILGLGGKSMSQQHIDATAKLINECEHINYLSTLQLGLSDTKEDAFFERFEKSGTSFEFLNDTQMLEEQQRFITQINPKKPIIFRSNHASNALPLKGTLPKDKTALLEVLNAAQNNEQLLRPEFLRGF
jgi:molybdenum cofactor biosynthesis enzyme MoaA